MSAMESRAGRQKLVLIVDDIDDNRLLLDRGLQSSGYRTMLASSGREALSMISQQCPDMVLLDWMMPQLTGLDTLRAIRELYPSSRLPVIMCTAIGEEESVVAAIQAGANDYVTKPVSLPILRARMATQFEQLALIDTLGTAKEAAEQRLGEQARTVSRAGRSESNS